MNSVYETFRHVSPLGFTYTWDTANGGNNPMHWHRELELVYTLNGTAHIVVDGTSYSLPKRRLLVVEENRLHSTHTERNSSMYLCIHVSRKRLMEYFPEFETRWIHCIPAEIPEDKFPKYIDICRRLEEMTRHYMMNDMAFAMDADGIILQVMASLIRDFSMQQVADAAVVPTESIDRAKAIMEYVAKNYASPISLADGAEVLGLGREYFARFFKKTMGISFIQYVNEIRLSHVYTDLTHTDKSIAEIMEDNGFTNQKLFNSMFKKVYGCTPTQVRKHPKGREDLFRQMEQL